MKEEGLQGFNNDQREVVEDFSAPPVLGLGMEYFIADIGSRLVAIIVEKLDQPVFAEEVTRAVHGID